MSSQSREKSTVPFTSFDKSRVFAITKDMNPKDFLTYHKKLHNLDPGPIYHIGYDMSKRSPVKTNP